MVAGGSAGDRGRRGFIGYRMIRLRRNAQAVREAMNTVETVQAVRQNLIESISVTGTIASADARDVSASAKDVKVLQVNYEEGDYVNAGDVIVVLDSSDLERSLSQARNSQALSEYKENKSIETASRSYSEAVEDGTDEYETAVKEEADAKEAPQEAGADVNETADSLKRQEERLGEAKEALAAILPEQYEGGAESQAYQDAVAAAERAVSEAQAEYMSRHQAYNAAAGSGGESGGRVREGFGKSGGCLQKKRPECHQRGGFSGTGTDGARLFQRQRPEDHRKL